MVVVMQVLFGVALHLIGGFVPGDGVRPFTEVLVLSMERRSTKR